MHLFLIRHAECLGQIDPAAFSDPDTALSPSGQQQAHSTAQRLATETPTHLVSSPLVRALTTATVLKEALPQCSLEAWPELVEVNSRSYTGLNRDSLIATFPSVSWADVPAQGWQYGGELYGGIFERCGIVLDRLSARFGDSARVALITHGGFANYLLNVILSISPSTPRWFELANCSLSAIRFVPNPQAERPNWPLFPPVQAEVLYLNDTGHLRPTA